MTNAERAKKAAKELLSLYDVMKEGEYDKELKDLLDTLRWRTIRERRR